MSRKTTGLGNRSAVFGEGSRSAPRTVRQSGPRRPSVPATTPPAVIPAVRPGQAVNLANPIPEIKHRTIDTDTIVSFGSAENWLKTLNCADCGYLVTSPYAICDRGGHLTCIECRARNSVCQFRNAASDEDEKVWKEGDVQNERTPGTSRAIRESAAAPAQGAPKRAFQEKKTGQKEKKRSGKGKRAGGKPCGGQLMLRPNIFVDTLLSSLLLPCQYQKQGCQELFPITQIQTHAFLCPIGRTIRSQNGVPQQPHLLRWTTQASVFRLPYP